MLGFVLLILYGVPFELHPTFKYTCHPRPRNQGSEAQRSMLSPNQSDHSRPPPRGCQGTTHREKQARTHKGEKHFEKDLAAGAIVSLQPTLPFPRLLPPLPDHVHTLRNTPAISL